MITEQNFNGFLAFVFFVSVPVAAILGIVIRARYRKAVSRAMKTHSGILETAFDVPPPGFPNGSAPEFDIAPLSHRPPLRLGLAVRYFVSGLAYAVVMVATMFVINGIEFLPLRFAVVAASFAFPALIMAFYVAGLRWYFILFLAVFWIWLLYLVAPESIDLIGIMVGPSFFLALLVGNPSLRTTAIPLFLVAVALVVPLVFSLDLAYFAMVTGVLDFLLVFLPPELITIIYTVLALIVVFTVGIGLARAVVKLVARMTAGSSEFMMQHDLLWLFQAVWMIGLGWGANGPIVLFYLLSFLAYRFVLWLLRPRDHAKEINLLLRVFGQPKHQTSLARSLLLDWRRNGPVLLIGASDLATETLDAPELAAFLNRRLGDIFIDGPADLLRVRTAGETRLGDGLFPMQDYYCRDNSWRPTVLTLMSRARRVLVDMRGFDPVNKGIQYEIHALAERVPAENIVVAAAPGSIREVQALFSRIWSQVQGAGASGRISLRVDCRLKPN